MLSGHFAGEATTCLQLGRDPYSSRGPGHPSAILLMDLSVSIVAPS